MKRIVTLDDFVETYTKLRQRGLGFILSKFTFSDTERAKTAFNHFNISSSNWSIIPQIKLRWQKIITSNEEMAIEDFTVHKFLKNRKGLKMLSLGSGNCASEIAFAKHPNFELILCTDIAEKRLKTGKKNAKSAGLKNIDFKIQDVNDLRLENDTYDIVYFKASLHHFKNVEKLVSKTLMQILKPNGLLIINEYVGPSRLQFPKHQIKAINKALKLIPKPYRKRYKLNIYKNKVYGPGWLRMILADPSECIDSENIMPSIHQNYNTVYEASYGGNILQLALKDIAHHFIDLNKEKKEVLDGLFYFEDTYLKNHKSDFIFGIYEPKTKQLTK
ncbi:class I SAM-dependent methyltransferase [Winogradskyella sp.]|uniref:class I SAM-dependent methyltransferase n=1 Tax=Winogradskyella sp. TaxID=1883156 RepID=UPI002625D7C4|nr:class I SAM-dependent methyltransferase [Winogradskyella sp.]